MINSLKYVKKLEEAGFTQEEAEATVKILIEVMEDRLATKDELKIIENELKELDHKIDRKFDQLSAELNHHKEINQRDIAQLKSDLTVKLGTMMGAMLSVAIAVVTVLIKFT